MTTDKIIKIHPSEKYYAKCPECNGTSWGLLLNGVGDGWDKLTGSECLKCGWISDWIRVDRVDKLPKKENITSWLDFFLSITLKQSHMAVKLLSKENVEKILSEKQLAVWQYIERVKKTSTGDIVDNTNIARPTVKQVLDTLLKLKKIERIGLGRSTRYRKI